jgi:hypothetical protein
VSWQAPQRGVRGAFCMQAFFPFGSGVLNARE